MGMVPGMGQPGAAAWQGKAAFKGEVGALGLVEWAPAPLLAAERALLQDAEALRAAGGAAGKKGQ